MSFRTRLTSFFVVIVLLPMIAVGVLVFRLISDSERGKADARASGLASAATSLYESETAAARADAQTLARSPGFMRGGQLQPNLSSLAAQAGLARVTVRTGSRLLADVGDRTAIAPGLVTVQLGTRRAPLTVAASELTAARFVRDLTAPGVALAVRQRQRTLGTTLRAARGQTFPAHGTVTVGGGHYRAVTNTFPGFGRSPVRVTVLSNLSATATSETASKVLAAAFIAGFLALALSFSLLASRGLQGQLRRFLDAARRLAGGDFSEPVPIQGRDEFAALGNEFNNMSTELARRLEELSQERARLRESIRRIGQTFASNLDRPALLELALKTAVDAVQASGGRLSVASGSGRPLIEQVREGVLPDSGDTISSAEHQALTGRGLGESESDGVSIVSVLLGGGEADGASQGVITVARRGQPFTDTDRELLRSLAGQAALALENVDLHFQVRRQAVTDELTGLTNHGRFHELLGDEMQQVRRYHYATGLIMLDIDDFKAINDTYGHQQGDVVLRQIARVVRDGSRDTDRPARYGGEEMAVILPHTDLEGAHAIAERIRTAIEALRVPRLDGRGQLRVTASVGVAASAEGHKDALIADADAALYDAKRQGKNRTIRASGRAANVFGPG
jgi:diguanylate cyclase (GGDEF)-like protein